MSGGRWGYSNGAYVFSIRLQAAGAAIFDLNRCGIERIKSFREVLSSEMFP
jgi:hypothetical protein